MSNFDWWSIGSFFFFISSNHKAYASSTLLCTVLTAETQRVLRIAHPARFQGLPTRCLAFHPGRQSIRLGPLPVLRPQRERRQRDRAAAGCPRWAMGVMVFAHAWVEPFTATTLQVKYFQDPLRHRNTWRKPTKSQQSVWNSNNTSGGLLLFKWCCNNQWECLELSVV